MNRKQPGKIYGIDEMAFAIGVGAIFILGLLTVLTHTSAFDSKPPVQSTSCHDYEVLSAAWNGPTGDAEVDDIAQRNIAQAKADCEAGK